MREIRPSGSEGGARFYSLFLPLSIDGRSATSVATRQVRDPVIGRGAAVILSLVEYARFGIIRRPTKGRDDSYEHKQM